MTHIAAFALGVLATLGLLWAFFYLFSTREETASVPADPYLDGLLAGEAW
jgi:hypothetical protein